MENLDYKNKNIDRKYLENMLKNRFLKDSPLELEEDFEELRDRDLKDREKKLKER